MGGRAGERAGGASTLVERVQKQICTGNAARLGVKRAGELVARIRSSGRGLRVLSK